PGPPPPPLPEEGEARVDALDGPALLRARARVAAPHQVVVHRHLREEAAGLGEVADAQAHDLVGPAARDLASVEHDAAGPRSQVAEGGLEQGGLARAVGPDGAGGAPAA